MGSTPRQVLAKVRLPLARRMLLLSVNQTILFALSMVVIAGLIGGKGLGDVVTSGLNSYPALALLAGHRDRGDGDGARPRHRSRGRAHEPRQAPSHRRASATPAHRLRRHGGRDHRDGRRRARARRRRGLLRARTARDWLLARLQSVLDYVQNPDTLLFQVTSWIGDHIVQYGLVPFRNFLVETPWPVTLIGITLISLVVSGRRSAITTFLMLALIGVIGEWSSAMDTASQVLVATVLTVVIGVGLGVWAAESRTFSRILRPVNDVLQTLPQLVYLIPLIYLMPVSVVPGVIAGVLYAFPVVARLVESGVRNVEANTVEAAAAFGATRRQILLKVKIPLAQDAIMLGVNQGIIMVLAVVVIGGLVGSPGLGYEVAQGLARSDFGLGVLASLAILALGIALDRVTRGARRSQQGGAD